MVKNSLFLISIALCLWFVSCKQQASPEELYGQWKYVKVQNTVDNPADTVSADELTAADPSIIFSKNGDLTIVWDGQPISTGKFRLEGNYIQYTETLTDGSTRTFPFFIRTLSGDDFIFETKGAEGTRVTAKRHTP